MDHRRGFTIIEILLSISAILVITAAFFSLTKVLMEKQGNSEKYYSALCLAQKTMESIKATSFEAIANSSFSNGQGTITVIPIETNLKEIGLSLKWHEYRPPIKLDTLRTWQAK